MTWFSDAFQDGAWQAFKNTMGRSVTYTDDDPGTATALTVLTDGETFAASGAVAGKLFKVSGEDLAASAIRRGAWIVEGSTRWTITGAEDTEDGNVTITCESPTAVP